MNVFRGTVNIWEGDPEVATSSHEVWWCEDAEKLEGSEDWLRPALKGAAK